MNDIQIRENAARRRLQKAGYFLRKTPARSIERKFHDVGYMVVDAYSNTVMLGATHWAYDGTLEEVEAFAAA